MRGIIFDSIRETQVYRTTLSKNTAVIKKKHRMRHIYFACLLGGRDPTRPDPTLTHFDGLFHKCVRTY